MADTFKLRLNGKLKYYQRYQLQLKKETTWEKAEDIKINLSNKYKCEDIKEVLFLAGGGGTGKTLRH